MWNLSGDDVKRAIEELRGRRAAIQARYEGELKKLEADLAELENFERFALKIASDYLGDSGPSAPAADPSPVAEESPIITVSERSGATSPEIAAEPEPASEPEPAGAAKGSSRWRMRLGAGETPRS
ncbi:MAG TPA: hypothetical protein VGQ90_16520 [Stellaceae bacterium]|jgi:hypothetical protein|nr:hypothetical protein [Stellaceae bacterium]